MKKRGIDNKVIFSFITAKTIKNVLITITVLGLVLFFAYIIFTLLFGDIRLLNANYTPKDQLVTKENLLHDIEIMKIKDGIITKPQILSNTEIETVPELIFMDNEGKRIDGDLISIGMNNKIFTDSKKPLEVNFFMRIMLYLRERNLSPDLRNLIGISGGFSRNGFEKFDGEPNSTFKISIDEFNNLYNEANVSNLDTEKQIDILTNLWIQKTGYFRRGLNGFETNPNSPIPTH